MTNYTYLWPYALASFFYYGFIGCFISYLAMYLFAQGFDSIDVGFVFASYMLGRVLLGFCFSYLSDVKQNPLYFYRAGMLGTFCFLLVCLLIENSYSLLILLVLALSCFMGVASQVEILCLKAVKGNSHQYNRLRLFGSAGFVFFAILMGFLLDKYAAVSVMYCGIFTVAAGGLLSFKMGRFTRQSQNMDAPLSFINQCLSPLFISFLIASILIHASFAPFVGFFTQYLSLKGYAGAEIGMLFSVGALAEIVLFFYAGAILRCYQVKTLFLFCFLVTSFRWYIQGQYIENPTVAIMSQCLHAFSFGLMHSVSVHFISRYFPLAQQARGQFMFFGAAFGVGTAIGAFVTGILWQGGHGSELTFNIAAIVCLLAAVIIALVPQKQFQLGMSQLR